MDFKNKAIEIIEGVDHPAINHSLCDLGIIKSYEINENNVQIVMAFPSLSIPILDALIQKVQQPLEAMNGNVNIEKVVMTQDDLQKFLAMEQSAWKGM